MTEDIVGRLLGENKQLGDEGKEVDEDIVGRMLDSAYVANEDEDIVGSLLARGGQQTKDWSPVDLVDWLPEMAARQIATTESLDVLPGVDEELRHKLYKYATGEDWMTEAQIQQMDPIQARYQRRKQQNIVENFGQTFHDLKEDIPQLAGGIARGIEKHGLSPFDDKEADWAGYGRGAAQVGKELVRGFGLSLVDFATAPIEQLQRDPLEFLGNVSIVGGAGIKAATAGKALAKGAAPMKAYGAGAMAADKFQLSMRPTVLAKKGLTYLSDKTGVGKNAMQWLVDPNFGVAASAQDTVQDFTKGAPAKQAAARLLMDDLTRKVSEDAHEFARASGMGKKAASAYVRERLDEIHKIVSEPQMLLQMKEEVLEDMRIIFDNLGDNPAMGESKIRHLMELAQKNPVEFDKYRIKYLKQIIGDDGLQIYDTIDDVPTHDLVRLAGGEIDDAGLPQNIGILEKQKFDGTKAVKHKRRIITKDAGQRLFAAEKKLGVEFTANGRNTNELGWLMEVYRDDFDPSQMQLGIKLRSESAKGLLPYQEDMLAIRQMMWDLDQARPNMVVGRAPDGSPLMMRSKEGFVMHAGGYFPDVYDVSKKAQKSGKSGGIGMGMGWTKKGEFKDLPHAAKKAEGLQSLQTSWETVVPQQIRANAYFGMMDDLSRNGDVAMDVATFQQKVAEGAIRHKDFVMVPIEGVGGTGGNIQRYGALSGMMVHKPTFNRVKYAAKATSDFDRWFRRLASSWKQNMVINNPSSHMHAMFGNVVNQILDGGSPHNLIAAAKNLKDQDEWYRAFIKSGGAQESARQIGLIRDAVDDLASAGDHTQYLKNSFKAIMDPDISLPEKGVRMVEYTTREGFGLGGKMQRAFVANENASRLAIFKRNVKRMYKRKHGRLGFGKEDMARALSDQEIIKEAAKRVNMIQLDYAEVPLLHKLASRYAVIPFISYAWKASGLFADVHTFSPKVTKALRYSGDISERAMDQDERDRQSYAPHWRQGGLTQPIGDLDFNARWLSPVPAGIKEMLGVEGLGGYGSDLYKDKISAEDLLTPGPLGSMAKPLLSGKDVFGRDLEGGDRWLEAALGGAPGYLRQFVHKVMPAMQDRRTPRGEEISAGMGVAHMVGIRAHKPEQWKSLQQAEYGFNMYMSEIKKEFEREVIASNGDQEDIKDAQELFNKKLRKAVNRMQFLMGRNK